MQNKNHDRRKLMQEIKAKLLLADFDKDCKNLQKSESPDLKDEALSLGVEVVSVTDEEETEIFNQADKASASADPHTKKNRKVRYRKKRRLFGRRLHHRYTAHSRNDFYYSERNRQTKNRKIKRLRQFARHPFIHCFSA